MSLRIHRRKWKDCPRTFRLYIKKAPNWKERGEELKGCQDLFGPCAQGGRGRRGGKFEFSPNNWKEGKQNRAHSSLNIRGKGRGEKEEPASDRPTEIRDHATFDCTVGGEKKGEERSMLCRHRQKGGRPFFDSLRS